MPVSTIQNASLAAGVPARSNMPAGTVLQVVNARFTAQNTTTSTSFTATNITASITPSSSSNRILILVSGGGWIVPTTNTFYTTIARNTTVLSGSSGLSGIYGNDGTAFIGFSYVDSPATTSSTSYTVYFRVSGGTGRMTEETNGTSSITLLEIAG